MLKYHSLLGKKVMRKARNGFQYHSHVSISDDEAVTVNTTNLSGSAAAEGLGVWLNTVAEDGKGGELAGVWKRGGVRYCCCCRN
jgi:hypothetical protein